MVILMLIIKRKKELERGEIVHEIIHIVHGCRGSPSDNQSKCGDGKWDFGLVCGNEEKGWGRKTMGEGGERMERCVVVP